MSLNSVTKLFHAAYESDKKVAKRKAQRQQEMFAEMTKAVSKGVLQQRIVDYPEKSELAPEEYVQTYYPGWRLVSDNENRLLIEEDPTLAKFTWVNPKLGMVFGRTQVESGPALDDERLKTEDPKLYESLTQWPSPWYEIAVEIASYSAADAEEFVEEIFKAYQIQKQFKAPSEWTPEQVQALQDYMVPGRVSVRLVAPRKATEEELQ